MKKLSHLVRISPLCLFAACGLQQDIKGFDELGYDPLIAPGSRKAKVQEENDTRIVDDAISQGSYVEVALANASFFDAFPSGDSKPSRVLAKGVALQVLEVKGEIYHVRQVENGQEGYVVNSAVSSEPVLPDVDPEEIGEFAVLEEGVETVSVGLPPLEQDLVVDPEDFDPMAGVVEDDGVVGGTVVADEESVDLVAGGNGVEEETTSAIKDTESLVEEDVVEVEEDDTPSSSEAVE